MNWRMMFSLAAWRRRLWNRPDPEERNPAISHPGDVEEDSETISVDNEALERLLEQSEGELPAVIERAVRADGGTTFAPGAGEEVAECPQCGRNVQKNDLSCWFCGEFLRKPTVREFREMAEGSGLGDPLADESEKLLSRKLVESGGFDTSLRPRRKIRELIGPWGYIGMGILLVFLVLVEFDVIDLDWLDTVIRILS